MKAHSLKAFAVNFLLVSSFFVFSNTSIAFSRPPIDDETGCYVDDGKYSKIIEWLNRNSKKCNSVQADRDGDGYDDNDDKFPDDPSEWSDLDYDGIGDNSDEDRDGDGYSNIIEEQLGSDPNKNTSRPDDLDNDGNPDQLDSDIDGDGVENESDLFPMDAGEHSDLDGDGIGDNSDSDRDGDGVPNALDFFPNNAAEWFDLDGDGIGDNADVDRDGDGVDNPQDAFPNDPAEQADLDGDGTGDNSDADRDGDGVNNNQDTFPNDATEQSDLDQDGIGDNGDTDRDGDGIENQQDDFPNDPTEQTDLDADGIGDNADTDLDGDGVENSLDQFPLDPLESADLDADGIGDNADIDRDGDGVENSQDAFPGDASEQSDLDGDGIGDNVDPDLDGDGVENSLDQFPLDSSESADLDQDGIGDNADTDRDGDGTENTQDAFPNDATEQSDIDGDGIGDNTDTDRDGDGVENSQDVFPNDAAEQTDLDGDGIGDNADSDRDGDGISNTLDIFPNDATEWLDLDGDGIGNNSDSDRDGDGVSNQVEIQLGTDPDDATSFDEDLDSDGIRNDLDSDRDGDGIENDVDAFPNDVTESSDLDQDGIGDNADTDRDGDGTENIQDAFPNDATEQSDLDGDGIGDNADTDRDGDGISNALDMFPSDATEWLDLDGDGIGDNADTDRDGDGTENTQDAFPNDATEQSDLDGDGIGDNTDTDRDGDGTENIQDAFPNDATEQTDLDGDGIGDNADTDRDGDGIENTQDKFPNDATEQSDLDGDGMGDNADTDRDGDGTENIQDAFPNDATEQTDLDGDGIGDNADTDRDGDGTENTQDAFPNDATEQTDLDGDGIGDNADTDRDGDGTENIQDAFPNDATEQTDLDGDGIGDNVDTDRDGDGTENIQDAFPNDATEQSDLDGDGIGDKTDTDRDGDGTENTQDAFPNDATEQTDLDGDGIGDNADTDRDGDGTENIQDAFPNDATEQTDLDGDGIGDNADTDRDGDGTENTQDEFPNDATEQTDLDGDGIGDNADTDRDGDGTENTQDEFPNDATEQSDLDGDGIGDNADTDRDGDGTENIQDAFPNDATEQSDLDGDGIGDNADTDRDGDGVSNTLDMFPNDSTEWLDLDGDGIGNNTDVDRDGDGISNEIEIQLGTNPNDAESVPLDLDSDGIPNELDQDRDGDGVENDNDSFPDNALEQSDLDGDGIGDNADIDRDGDGVDNDQDAFPNESSESSDLDGDGIGDNADSDLDGDGISNTLDMFPNDASEWLDLDGDGIGDNADTDRDGDGTENTQDAFPNDATEQSDLDGDGIGDHADTDRDGDGTENTQDAFPNDATEQSDLDVDGIGDNADTDRDGDGISNTLDMFPNDGSEWLDLDGDGIGDNADTDRDGDGTENTQDAFPNNAAEQSDLDGDGIGDNADPDRDGDGADNSQDAFPNDATEQSDFDGDGIGDNTDTDRDGDNIDNANDQCPDTNLTDTVDENGCSLNFDDADNDGIEDALDLCVDTEAGLLVDAMGCAENQLDTDNDGIINSLDTDDDDDSYLDVYEIAEGTDPRSNLSRPGSIRSLIQGSLVPRTGAVVSYAALDDGDKQNGRTRDYSRNDELEIVTDNVNDLIWQDSVDSKDFTGTWVEANNYCQNSTFAGIDNWRLPNRYELIFLVDLNKVGKTNRDPMVGPEFINAYRYDGYYAQSYNYWTFERNSNRSQSIVVNFRSGAYSQVSATDTNHMRCVSGDQKFLPDTRRGTSTVYDIKSQLIWQDTVDVQTNLMSWDSALHYCANLDIDGVQNWRLPNFNESQLIVNELAASYPSDFVNQHVRSGSDDPLWWTSTTDDLDQTHAWSLFAFYGQTNQLSDYKSRSHYVRCVRDYNPPVVIAGGSITAKFGDEIIFDGSRSYVDSASLINYRWYESYSTTLSTEPVFSKSNLSVGNHNIVLSVTDQWGAVVYHAIDVKIEEKLVNQPPIANAGSDSSYELGDNAILDGSLSFDPDGSIASYSWKENGSVISTNAQFAKDDFSIGAHTLELTITDNQGLSSVDSVTITIIQTPINLEPTANAGPDSSYEFGDTAILDGSLSFDPDGSIASYSWKENGNLVSSNAQFTKSDFTIGLHTLELTVTDNQGLSSVDEVIVTIIEKQNNLKPVANAGLDRTVAEGNSITLDASASYDPEGSNLSYKWGDERNILLSESASFTLNGIAPGVHTYDVFVIDDQGLESTDSVTITVEEKQFNTLSLCPAQEIINDSRYIDTYPENDIPWSGYSWTSVSDIEKGFNEARIKDASISKYLVMPSQSEWDALTAAQKGLFLLNTERLARGIKPFDGIANEITSVVQAYADYHLDNNLIIGHLSDGKSPEERLDANAYIVSNRDGHISSESGYSLDRNENTIDENAIVVQAMYTWIYADASPYSGGPWGHRSHMLQVGLNENNGASNSEGVLGFGISTGNYNPFGDSPEGYLKGAVVFINTIDPSTSWDLSNITTVDINGSFGCNNQTQAIIDETAINIANLESLVIESTNLMLAINDSASLRVLAKYNDTSEVDVSSLVSFVADERSIVSINSGLVTALSEGYATVYAQVGSISSNRITVTVGTQTDISNLIGSEVQPLSEYIPSNTTIDGYDTKLLSVYTGQVVDGSVIGLEGVQVSFLNHPEYGSVTSDTDGRFIIAAPSGLQTFIYEKSGYLTVQRQGIGQSSNWTNIETVALLPLDNKRTFIDLSSGQTQVHESSTITDEFGSRKATVVFNNISTATVRSADGFERSLTDFWLSATEFETPESMPGPLPENSVFTYCTKLWVEGTQFNDTVQFNNDVVMFVDNFLGFEVGDIIPVGFFDTIESNWKASKNGVVVQLLDTDSDGVVDGIDYNNDGTADDLNNNGQTQDDALGLGSYTAGATLMWGAFNHFSAVDYNPSGSKGEVPSAIEMFIPLEDENNDETACTGSYVMPYQQSFHEDIEIAGTDLTLHYTSQRTKDYKHVINIKVSGDTLSPNLQSMTARLEIAGKVYQRDFIPAENVSTEFIWDGKDIYGNRPKGKVSGRIRIGYEYTSTYQSTGSATSADLSSFPIAWDREANIDTGIQTRQNYTSWKNSGISLQNTFESHIAEGWSFSNVHEYDPVGKVYKGDGSVFEVASQSNVVKTGQTFSHVEGDDGYYHSGGKTLDYKITDLNTIIDINTGLEWQNISEPSQSVTRAGAAAYCEASNEAGYDDWRIPTEKESLYAKPKFSTVAGVGIFSSTRPIFWNTKTAELGNAYDITCVRGESINTRFVERLKRNNTLEVVIDRDNGLMWQDNSENVSGLNDFASSIQYCENLEHAEFNDWRLPNINELLYVLPNDVFENQTDITWPEDEPFWDYSADYVRAYWASTSHGTTDDRAWAIESEGFSTNDFLKERALFARCVRDDSTASRMPFKFDNKGKHIATIDLDTGKELIHFNYNESNQLISMVDQFANTISITRDGAGNVTSIVAPDGQTTELSISNQNIDAVSYENNTQFTFYYDGALLTDKIDRNGHTYTHVFDADGRVIQTTDVEGGQWDFFDDKTQFGENRYGFNTAEGQLYETLRSVLENGDIQKVTTHKDGSVVTNTLQADQLKETIVSHGVTAVIDKVIDEKTQDEIPSVITVAQPNGLTSVTGLQKVYGENGADTSQHTVTLSVNNRTSTVVTNAKAGTVITTSAEGRISQQISDVDTLQLKTSTSSGLTDTRYEYDARGRIHYITTGDRTTIYDYSDANDRGNVSSITAPDGKITYFDYDLMDRVTKTIYPDGHATQTEYDNTGNAKTLVVPTIKDHAFTYSGVNKVKTQSTPLNETIEYTYDADRRLTQIELPSGQVINNSYINGKLDKTTTQEGVIDYQYINGNQLSAITEGTESLAYGYNGDLLTDIHYDGELKSSITQGYDNNFWLNSLSYAGASTSLSYDNDGLLTGLNGFTITRHIQHGLPTQVSNSKLNQVMEYNGYGENKGRTTTVNNKRTYDYGLTYNLIGQITGKTETLADGTENTFVYGYDDKRRLISVTKNSVQVESYDYDANGNRKLKSSTWSGITDQVATFNIADQQQTDGTTQFEYDTNGRLSKKLNPIVNGTAIEEYSYSSQGRLLSVTFKEADQTTNVTTAIKSITYKHNALGNRVAKLVDGISVEKYLWLNKTTLLATYDQNNNLKQRFEYGLGHTPVKFTQNSNTYYITSDHLGSPRIITDESGSVIKAIDYDSFGNVVSDSNSAFEIPFGFAGGLKDSDTQLLRFGYRDYDPSIGRWTARDPIGFAGGDTNLYGYTASNPVNFLDPTGLVVSVGSRDVVRSGGLGAHTYTNVTSNGQSVTYSSHNVDGVNQVIRNHPSDHGTNKLPETSSVIIAPPTGMSQEQWDRRVIESAERLISGDQDGYILFPPKGGTSGKKNRRGNGGGKKSNCHVTTNRIIQGAGGNIPMSYNPPGFNPGL